MNSSRVITFRKKKRKNGRPPPPARPEPGPRLRLREDDKARSKTPGTRRVRAALQTGAATPARISASGYWTSRVGSGEPFRLRVAPCSERGCDRRSRRCGRAPWGPSLFGLRDGRRSGFPQEWQADDELATVAGAPSLCAVTRPPCISTSLRSSARPMPNPPFERWTVPGSWLNISKRRRSTSAVMPMPRKKGTWLPLTTPSPRRSAGRLPALPIRKCAAPRAVSCSPRTARQTHS